MNKDDLQLLRTAALELQESSDDLVRVASIVNRVKNWWKARFSKEFAERQEKVEEAYSGMKGPLSELIKQLTEMDKAFKSQDPNAIAQLVGQVPGTIAQVTKDMGNLSKKMRAADAVIPVTYYDEKGNEVSGGNLSWITSGYKKNRELIEKLWEHLPEPFKEIPIGKRINRPITDFVWFSRYDPSQVSISTNVKNYIKADLRTALVRGKLDSEAIDFIIQNGFDDFIENLKVAILQNSILLQVNFPSISKDVTHRRANEMEVQVWPGYVALPVMSYQFYVDVAIAVFNDLGAAITPTNKLSVLKVRHINLSMETVKALKQEWRKNRGLPQEVRSLEERDENVQEGEAEIVDPIVQEDTSTGDGEVIASGPIASIVKKAILREQLPMTPAVVKVDGLEFHHKARFAKVLASALRQEIDAECSVRNKGENVEVQVFASGSKMNVVPAIYGISTYVADKYLGVTKAGVEVDVQPGRSNMEVMSSEVLDQSFRKVAFDLWRVQ